MRISILARELKVKPSEIINYLESIGIETDKGVNTKLVKAGVDRVLEHFESLKDEFPVEKAIEKVEDTNQVSEEIEESKNTHSSGESTAILSRIPDEEKPVEENKQPETEEKDSEPERNEKDEVIRPKLVKLQGLRVLGKIEIPEPTKKEKPESSAEEVKTPIQSTERQNKSHKYGKKSSSKNTGERRRPHKKKKELTYAQKLKIEEKKLEKERARKQILEKEQKRKAYEEKMKLKKQPKTQKKQKIDLEPETIEKKAAKPKSMFGKFIYWLNN